MAARITVRGDVAGPSRQYALSFGLHLTVIENRNRELQLEALGVIRAGETPVPVTIESLARYLPPGYPLDAVVRVR